MTKSVSAQAQPALPIRSENPWSRCGGIEFDEDELTPEEQQLELTRRAIWKKLMARLQMRSS
jgi:hypothetical protein